jgi:nucleotide-binding universal stress UspA family protein
MVMTYKTILVHCGTGPTSTNRLEVTLGLAKSFDAHVIGVYVRPIFEAPIFTDNSAGMDALYEAHFAMVKADEIAASILFKDAIISETRSSEWIAVDGRVDEAILDETRQADLVIVGQPEPTSMPLGMRSDLPEYVALSSGRPVLVVPYISVTKTPGQRAMLCWNGSREATLAATRALPILERAADVTLLVIGSEGDTKQAESAGRIGKWLARHDVKVTVQRDTAGNSDIGSVILSRAADFDIDLIVMGIYGHSRLREIVLGGASRTLLASMTVPLLIAH